MKKNKMTTGEIVTYFLKTGTFPDYLMALPKEKVTLQKNETFTIRYRDIYDELKKDNPFKGLYNEQFNLIASNISDFHKTKKFFQVMDMIQIPEKYIYLLKTEHAKKVVFIDRNPAGTEFMKKMLILYRHICLNPEEYYNTDDEMNKRIIKYLQTQYDWMTETLERIQKMEKQPSPIDKDITDKKPKLLKEKTEVIINALNQYRFSEFLIEHGFKVEAVYELIKKHSGKELLPYTIGLLHETKYLDYFFNKFPKNKTEGITQLGKVFNINKRRIKGNINILNPHSNEDPSQYTSVSFIEKIQIELRHCKEN